MDTFFDVIFKLIEIAVVCIAVYVAFDIYMFVRGKFESPVQPQSSATGSEITGELTTGAKYAIWRYMFFLFGVGGAIIGVVSGVAGYMINDLAKEKAIQVALREMQKPLEERLAQFADAQSALNTAIKTVNDEKFKTKVADTLSGDGDFQKKVAEVLNNEAFQTKIIKALNDEAFRANIAKVLNDEAFRANITKVLFDLYSTQIRGPAGPPGTDGTNGTSPTAASVAQSINDEAFRANIAKVLADQHSTQLRGLAGSVGPTGPAGPAGKDGSSPTATSVAVLMNDAAFRANVARLLADQYSNQLRGLAGPPGGAGPLGPAGPAGKDGGDGSSPTAASVAQLINDAAFQTNIAKVLADQYNTQLRGPAGPPGPSGPVGPAGPVGKDGRDGANGTSPSTASVAQLINDGAFQTNIAKVLADQYNTQLRGPAGLPGPAGPAGPIGPAGKDGRDGVSPSQPRGGARRHSSR
jgi:hypothetical protein